MISTRSFDDFRRPDVVEIGLFSLAPIVLSVSPKAYYSSITLEDAPVFG